MTDCQPGYFLYKNTKGKIKTRKTCKVNSTTSKNTKVGVCVKKNYSFKKIEQEDLHILYDVVINWLKKFTQRKDTKRYKDLKLLGICLCQGSAQHFVDEGKGRGLNDFDIWLFFEKHNDIPDFPHRQVYNEFFPNDKFGHSADCINRCGRRIDIIGRSIKVSIEDWIKNNKNKSPQELRKAPVILLKKDKSGNINTEIIHNGKTD